MSVYKTLVYSTVDNNLARKFHQWCLDISVILSVLSREFTELFGACARSEYQALFLREGLGARLEMHLLFVFTQFLLFMMLACRIVTVIEWTISH